MEAQNLKIDNLVDVFGSLEIANKAIKGELEFSAKQAEVLAKLFNVSYSGLFHNFWLRAVLRQGFLSA